MPMAGAFVIASGGRTDAPPEQLAGLGAIRPELMGLATRRLELRWGITREE
jgi:hypothetical protein